MSVNEVEGHEAQERSRCQMGYLASKSSSSSCAEPAEEEVDGLLLCERHALEAKLEGQIECWGALLWHIEFWSGEARGRNRTRIAELIDVERAKATAAMERASEDLHALRRGEKVGEEVNSVSRGFIRRDPLRLLPRAGQPSSQGHRRLRRR